VRENFTAIFDIIWTEVKPVIEQLHDSGVRPDAQAVDVGGWLPLMR
jgi:hypothetical protein